MEEGISLFSSLLNNKHFLIVFVHALEQQKDFAVRDRSGRKRRWDTGVPSYHPLKVKLQALGPPPPDIPHCPT